MTTDAARRVAELLSGVPALVEPGERTAAVSLMVLVDDDELATVELTARQAQRLTAALAGVVATTVASARTLLGQLQRFGAGDGEPVAVYVAAADRTAAGHAVAGDGVIPGWTLGIGQSRVDELVDHLQSCLLLLALGQVVATTGARYGQGHRVRVSSSDPELADVAGMTGTVAQVLTVLGPRRPAFLCEVRLDADDRMRLFPEEQLQPPAAAP